MQHKAKLYTNFLKNTFWVQCTPDWKFSMKTLNSFVEMKQEQIHTLSRALPTVRQADRNWDNPCFGFPSV